MLAPTSLKFRIQMVYKIIFSNGLQGLRTKNKS